MLQIAADTVLIAVSFVLAIVLRVEGVGYFRDPRVWMALVCVIPPTIALFYAMGFYHSIVRFVSWTAMRVMMVGIVASSFGLAAANFGLGQPLPRSVPFIYLFIALFLIGGVRFAMRLLYDHGQQRHNTAVIIYGAGSAGRQLQASLMRGEEYRPVAFVDDARELQGTYIGGLRVYNPQSLPRLIERTDARMLLLAMPSIGQSRRRAILNQFEMLPVQLRTVPGSADLVSGLAQVNNLREVAVEELLGRDPVPPDADLLAANITGKSVMVTGAGGSIGAELCRQILLLRPARLVLFEMSEYALYMIHDELTALIAGRPSLGSATQVVPILGSVRDADRIGTTLSAHGVQTIYHAAAYKHVPMVEANVVEGLRNNLFGTAVLAEAAVAEGVETFILISTDKAVRPTNVMGATKRMAELVCQAWAQRQTETRFSMVRFGNVLGSSGSVIPLFRRQIAAGGPITVTHPDITRYFMTIPEAVQLVIQAGAMSRGGDVFVLDMGEPVRIVDLATRMALLHGLKPVILPPGSPADSPIDGDIAITFSKLRPGEKLYEELLIGDSSEPTQHPRILTAHEISLDWPHLTELLMVLSDACERCSVNDIRQLMVAARIGYAPRDLPVPLNGHSNGYHAAPVADTTKSPRPYAVTPPPARIAAQ